MADHNQENIEDMQAQASGRQPGEELDAAGKSLSEALRISFVILKVIMVALVIFFLASGFRTVGSDEQALVLRLGKIRGVGERRLLGPGLHWVFPYPIDEIVRIPVEKNISLPINSFWYSQTRYDLLSTDPKRRVRVPETLDPVKDGYCLTRSEKQTEGITDSAGSDYNIVHCKWQLIYRIDDPERFFQNVYVDLESIEAGQNYADVIPRNVTPLLEHAVGDAIVTATVNYTIDEAMYEQVAAVAADVKGLLQERLDKIESGIKVVSVQLTDITWPRQVDEAFRASIEASQKSDSAISEAKTYAENTLIEAGGQVAEELLAALRAESVSQEQREYLWSRLAGAAQERIAEARIYRTKVVASAEARVDYLKQILPECRKRPELVLQEIYLGAIVDVLRNADEKFVLQPDDSAGGREVRIYVNRDPRIKPKPGEQKNSDQ
jgi:membrane protease subunit HflK